MSTHISCKNRKGAAAAMRYNAAMPARSRWATFYRIFLLFVLTGLALAVFMALRRPPPVALPVAAESVKSSADSFHSKLEQLAGAQQRHEKSQARLSSDEVNAALFAESAESASPVQAPPGVAASQPAASAAQPLSPGSDIGEAGEIQTTQVFFHEDEVTGQFTTPIYGKDVVITVSGRLASKDGYVTFDPTDFRVGDLTIPASLVNDALQKKLAEPENREKLQLPPYLSGVHVENGELVIEEQ
jgi:hypothetical protein